MIKVDDPAISFSGSFACALTVRLPGAWFAWTKVKYLLMRRNEQKFIFAILPLMGFRIEQKVSFLGFETASERPLFHHRRWEVLSEVQLFSVLILISHFIRELSVVSLLAYISFCFRFSNNMAIKLLKKSLWTFISWAVEIFWNEITLLFFVCVAVLLILLKMLLMIAITILIIM